MLSPRNSLGLEAKNYGLGLALIASGLGLGLVHCEFCGLSLELYGLVASLLFRKTLLHI